MTEEEEEDDYDVDDDDDDDDHHHHRPGGGVSYPSQNRFSRRKTPPLAEGGLTTKKSIWIR